MSTKTNRRRDTAIIDARHNFDEADLSKFGGEIAALTQKKIQKEKQRKEVASQYKADLESLESKIDSLSLKVTNGYEMRTTPCWVEYDFENGRKCYYRKSDGVKVDEREMTNNDFQTKMSFDMYDVEEDESDTPEPKQLNEGKGPKQLPPGDGKDIDV